MLANSIALAKLSNIEPCNYAAVHMRAGNIL